MTLSKSVGRALRPQPDREILETLATLALQILPRP